jgi:hypothetical protein
VQLIALADPLGSQRQVRGSMTRRWKTFGRGIYLLEFKHVTVSHEESTSQVIVWRSYL